MFTALLLLSAPVMVYCAIFLKFYADVFEVVYGRKDNYYAKCQYNSL